MNRLVRAGVAFAAVLAAWKMTSVLALVPQALFPAPEDVFAALLGMARSGELLRDLGVSVWRGLMGLLIGAVVGVMMGTLTGRLRAVDDFLSPLFHVLRPLPPVAIIPLVILWWGVGDPSKIFSIAFAVFFPVWISAHLGAKGVPEAYVWVARSLGVSGFGLWLRVTLPASLPIVISGLRTAVAVSFVMVFVSELAGASAGLGYQISVSQLAYRVDRMLAALAVLSVAAAAADGVLAGSVRLMFPWLDSAELR